MQEPKEVIKDKEEWRAPTVDPMLVKDETALSVGPGNDGAGGHSGS